MAKDKLKAAMQGKDPSALRQAGLQRQAINPVKILQTTTTTKKKTEKEVPEEDRKLPENKTDEKNRTDRDIVKTDVDNRVQKQKQQPAQKKRTKKASIYSGQNIQSVLALEKRETKRYSFEIYLDQIDNIEEVCELYEEVNDGRKLSASRLIREVLDDFLPSAVKAYQKLAEEKRGEIPNG